MPEPTLPFALAARRLGGSISTGRPDSVTAACAGGIRQLPLLEGGGERLSEAEVQHGEGSYQRKNE